MVKRKGTQESVRWDLALRYRLIETIAWWEGRLTTNHLMQSFDISRQQASKDINSYIQNFAPDNLEYDKHLRGYAPTRHFKPCFIDHSVSAYLRLLNLNTERARYIEGLAIAYTYTEVLEVQDRSLTPEVLRPILRACREGLRLECEYVSFNTTDGEVRLIVPHTLVYTGMRWHVRAYCERNRDFRDFVLSRFRGIPDILEDISEYDRKKDSAWNSEVNVTIVPDPRLAPDQQTIVEHDYGMQDGKLVVNTRGALAQYVLLRYQIDPAGEIRDDPLAQQIVAANLDELKDRGFIWGR